MLPLDSPRLSRSLRAASATEWIVIVLLMVSVGVTVLTVFGQGIARRFGGVTKGLDEGKPFAKIAVGAPLDSAAIGTPGNAPVVSGTLPTVNPPAAGTPTTNPGSSFNARTPDPTAVSGGLAVRERRDRRGEQRSPARKAAPDPIERGGRGTVKVGFPREQAGDLTRVRVVPLPGDFAVRVEPASLEDLEKSGAGEFRLACLDALPTTDAAQLTLAVSATSAGAVYRWRKPVRAPLGPAGAVAKLSIHALEPLHLVLLGRPLSAPHPPVTGPGSGGSFAVVDREYAVQVVPRGPASATPPPLRIVQGEEGRAVQPGSDVAYSVKDPPIPTAARPMRRYRLIRTRHAGPPLPEPPDEDPVPAHPRTPGAFEQDAGGLGRAELPVDAQRASMLRNPLDRSRAHPPAIRLDPSPRGG